MSLAQHVTQFDGHDYEGPAGVKRPEGDEERASLLRSAQQASSVVVDENETSEWRRLSYAPADFAPEERKQHHAAFKVSNLKRAGPSGYR